MLTRCHQLKCIERTKLDIYASPVARWIPQLPSQNECEEPCNDPIEEEAVQDDYRDYAEGSEQNRATFAF